MSVSLTFSIEGLTRKKRYVVYTERDIERERERGSYDRSCCEFWKFLQRPTYMKSMDWDFKFLFRITYFVCGIQKLGAVMDSLLVVGWESSLVFLFSTAEVE